MPFRKDKQVRVNVIILNYNGEKLMPLCLPSIIEAKNFSAYPVRITVIDNESSDLSLKIIDSFGEEINTVKSSNRVLCSFNDVVLRQEEEIAILLNNDLRVEKGFIDPLVEILEKNKNVFMTAPKCFNFSGTQVEGGSCRGFVKNGWFGALARYPGWEKDLCVPGLTFQSGFGAVNRNKFLELGGYDDLYLPGRLEDSDLCFRAWKRGWKCYYEPKSIVYHMGGASFGKKYGKKGVSWIDSRNSALFFWKNISDFRYWVAHLMFFPVRIAWWFLRGELSAIRGFFAAFKKIPEVKRKREVWGKASCKLSDSEVFDLFK